MRDHLRDHLVNITCNPAYAIISGNNQKINYSNLNCGEKKWSFSNFINSRFLEIIYFSDAKKYKNL